MTTTPPAGARLRKAIYGDSAMQRPGQSVNLSATNAIAAVCLILVCLFLGRFIADMFWSILGDLSRVTR